MSNQNLLSIRQLLKTFGDLRAVDEVSFGLEKGELLGLIGPNGAGKTTLINCITGVYTPNQGDILYQGENITNKHNWQIKRKGVSRTFQISRLMLQLSTYDNVLIGTLPNQRGKITSALMNRSKFRGQLRETIDKANELFSLFNEDLIDQGFSPAGELSQIDRRRLEVVRALMIKPKVLLLDEPTAGMTVEESMEFLDDISTIQERYPEIGIMLIEHDMMVIEHATDRVVCLNYGQKIAEGTFEEVSEQQEVKEAYLGE